MKSRAQPKGAGNNAATSLWIFI